ncbi:MAG: Crp/Fnr family transcriptional regulator [Terriglobales bacterium]
MRNSVLFREGDPGSGVFLLTQGKARLSQVYAQAMPTQIVGPGAILGLPCAIGNCPYNFTAEILEDSKLGFIPRREIVRLLRSKPEHCLQVVELLGCKVREVYSVKARWITPRRRRRIPGNRTRPAPRTRSISF